MLIFLEHTPQIGDALKPGTACDLGNGKRCRFQQALRLFYPQDVDIFVDAEAGHLVKGTAQIILADIELLGKVVQRE